MDEDKLIARGWHHTFGWLRRPLLDAQNGGYCYEDPEGRIIVSKMRIHRQGMYLHCYEDAETGERYTTPSVAPRIYKGRQHAR